MFDVIFSGVCSCDLVNMVEVMLIFNNVFKLFCVDIEEVCVGCWLYCSGESVYCINDKDCWFCDVKELLLDIGVNVYVYSIIV